ncbi:NADH dehydrogenase [ubiquinone] 1 alpha subcomplex subunit 13 [Agrilus planipennis]|uniref:NADH dehydrogenase [ubiquinone] 1 alpha subcomplex subunit 13 n=1 Tax=Agrilus planipennis TaxID=224129 RepID=A0A1W4WWH2_AGRPL|nr:NADH dehydrogenase [ubiquinone] 1 alpha subcomplex subunit 13 [Agrilus planipennis]
MSFASTARRQDMPPPGGYKPIFYKRNPAKTYFSGYTWIAIYFGVTAVGVFAHYMNWKKVLRDDLERRSGNFAIFPLLLAERDREYLKQLRRNRDEEADLMKNVEGWEVGTWYGEPLYKTLPKGTLVEPTYWDYYVHASSKDYIKRAYLCLWS